MESDTMDTLFTCGRPEEFPCRPLYNLLDTEEIAARKKEMDERMADFRKRNPLF
jgi:hypothetical protein